jgi:hypothetical protein
MNLRRSKEQGNTPPNDREPGYVGFVDVESDPILFDPKSVWGGG